jgi:hypothetical protein
MSVRLRYLLNVGGCLVGSLLGGWIGTRMAQGCPVWPW